MNLKEKEELLIRLEQAGTSCNDCGTKYGVYSVGCSTNWMGKCGVCGEKTLVTDSRDYVYFITGRQKLAKQIKNAKSRSKTKKQQSEEPSD